MGKAVVTSILDIPDRIVRVKIEKEISFLIAKEAELLATQTTLNTSIVTLTANVVSLQAAADSANAALTAAIAAEEPTSTIVALQQDLITATSNLVNGKTTLNVSTMQLASAEKELALISPQVLDPFSEPIDIPTADSGVSIGLGETIGVIEIARVTDDKATSYIAQPSERSGSSYLYTEARDGIALPELAIPPYTWFYNTSVVPSAQIYAPRYWLATLMGKTGTAPNETGTITYNTSSDFGTVPFDIASVSGVPFDYETTDSESFLVGDQVVVEHDATGTPTIIGFGTAKEPVVATQLTTGLYRRPTTGTGPLRWRLDQGWPTSPPPAFVNAVLLGSFDVSQNSGRGVNSARAGSELNAIALDAVEKAVGGRMGLQYLGTPQSATRLQTLLTGLNAVFVNWNQGGTGGGYYDIGIGQQGQTINYVRTESPTYFFPWRHIIHQIFSNGSNTPVEITDGVFRMYDIMDADSSIPGFDSNEIFSRGTSDFNVGGGPDAYGEPTGLYSKIRYVEDTSIVEKDYLFDAMYWDPIAASLAGNGGGGDFFLEVEQRFTNGDQTINVSLIEAAVYLRVERPPNQYSGAPVATTGPQNFLADSRVLDAAGFTNGTIIADQLTSPAITVGEPEAYIVNAIDDAAETASMIYISGIPTNMVSGQDYTYSAYVRRNAYGLLTFGMGQSDSTAEDTRAEVWFDLVRGTAESNVRNLTGSTTHGQDLIDFGMDILDDGWMRIWVVQNVVFTTNAPRLYFKIRPEDMGYINGTDQHNGVAIWGMQVNDGVAPTAYAATSGTNIP